MLRVRCFLTRPASPPPRRPVAPTSCSSFGAAMPPATGSRPICWLPCRRWEFRGTAPKAWQEKSRGPLPPTIPLGRKRKREGASREPAVYAAFRVAGSFFFILSEKPSPAHAGELVRQSVNHKGEPHAGSSLTANSTSYTRFTKPVPRQFRRLAALATGHGR
ncbi:MAG: hypothetical protein BJ554DRAFT_2195 [Olpidium bornovanus]|uniref:Uncharacterized protein n=1 Tax=Olpidium bornovanus TaxID=278681 RepID=A0A8H8A2D5_9FUNG|nr:MAG: hypothetical protein BJ554DRAFT_2195 [Olpidium bornovanus]